jgi:ABC-type lipoprotein release transport system permease subunit
MRHWSQIATRNWRVRPLRTAAAVAAIALGTAAVVWVTCTFESVSTSILSWANQYAGRSSVTIESPLGKFGTISQSIHRTVAQAKNVEHAVPLLMRRMRGALYSADRIETARLSGLRWNERMPELDVYGIQPELEPTVRDWQVLPGNGRMLSADDSEAFECGSGRARPLPRSWGCGAGR